MKFVYTILFSTIITIYCHAQEIPVTTEQQLENLTDVTETETEDDTNWQLLEQYKKHPLSLNNADAAELKELRIVSDLQIGNFLAYRKLLGNLISVYELQAIPSWDVATIQRLLPFVTVTNATTVKEEWQQRIKQGEHSFLFRLSQILEKAKGFDRSGTGSTYAGSPQRIFMRYRYNYKNLLQFGLLGDKDAGEQFLAKPKQPGFDFYSFHLFARKIGRIQSLALGDFTVNMGQGLIQWQSMAFKKSAEVMGIKRQSSVLRPYNAAGEYNFHRGAGITIQNGNVELTGFASYRLLSSNFIGDTATQQEYFSSFQTSGYHRTASEIADRNNLTQLAAGGTVKYHGSNWYIGFNTIAYQFSAPLQKSDEPYNLYAISGTEWYNLSVDYGFTYKNIHFFGEIAADKRNSKATVNGLLIGADSRVDISLLHRSISRSYEAINGNAFTENTTASNENGWYAGITIRPSNGWQLNAYADIFQFPFLKYRVDAPSNGKDFLVQLTYMPNKQTSIYTRFRAETKQANAPDDNSAIHYLMNFPRQNWRTQISYSVNSQLSFRNRVEALWYDKKGATTETGFLTFFDVLYRPLLKPYSGVLRLQYFETDGYNSRIYAYENDVLYSYSIPAFFDRGYRYYLTLNYDLGKKTSCWLRWGQTIYPGKQVIGSGLDEIKGPHKSEIKVQIRHFF